MEISICNKIRDSFIQEGMNSKFKGVQRDARNGTGRFGYKNAIAINSNEAE